MRKLVEQQTQETAERPRKSLKQAMEENRRSIDAEPWLREIVERNEAIQQVLRAMEAA